MSNKGRIDKLSKKVLNGGFRNCEDMSDASLNLTNLIDGAENYELDLIYNYMIIQILPVMTKTLFLKKILLELSTNDDLKNQLMGIYTYTQRITNILGISFNTTTEIAEVEDTSTIKLINDLIQTKYNYNLTLYDFFIYDITESKMNFIEKIIQFDKTQTEIHNIYYFIKPVNVLNNNLLVEFVDKILLFKWSDKDSTTVFNNSDLCKQIELLNIWILIILHITSKGIIHDDNYILKLRAIPAINIFKNIVQNLPNVYNAEKKLENLKIFNTYKVIKYSNTEKNTLIMCQNNSIIYNYVRRKYNEFLHMYLQKTIIKIIDNPDKRLIGAYGIIKNNTQGLIIKILSVPIHNNMLNLKIEQYKGDIRLNKYDLVYLKDTLDIGIIRDVLIHNYIIVDIYDIKKDSIDYINLCDQPIKKTIHIEIKDKNKLNVIQFNDMSFFIDSIDINDCQIIDNTNLNTLFEICKETIKIKRYNCLNISTNCNIIKYIDTQLKEDGFSILYKYMDVIYKKTLENDEIITKQGEIIDCFVSKKKLVVKFDSGSQELIDMKEVDSENIVYNDNIAQLILVDGLSVIDYNASMEEIKKNYKPNRFKKAIEKYIYSSDCVLTIPTNIPAILINTPDSFSKDYQIIRLIPLNNYNKNFSTQYYEWDKLKQLGGEKCPDKHISDYESSKKITKEYNFTMNHPILGKNIYFVHKSKFTNISIFDIFNEILFEDNKKILCNDALNEIPTKLSNESIVTKMSDYLFKMGFSLSNSDSPNWSFFHEIIKNILNSKDKCIDINYCNIIKPHPIIITEQKQKLDNNELLCLFLDIEINKTYFELTNLKSILYLDIYKVISENIWQKKNNKSLPSIITKMGELELKSLITKIITEILNSGEITKEKIIEVFKKNTNNNIEFDIDKTWLFLEHNVINPAMSASSRQSLGFSNLIKYLDQRIYYIELKILILLNTYITIEEHFFNIKNVNRLEPVINLNSNEKFKIIDIIAKDLTLDNKKKLYDFINEFIMCM